MSVVKRRAQMSLLPSLIADPRTAVAVQALRPIAMALWNHRQLLGDAVVSSKQILANILGSQHKNARSRGKKVSLSSNVATGSSSMTGLAMPTTNSMIVRNGAFTRFSATPDGNIMRVVGSELLGSCARFNTGATNNFAITGLDQLATGGSLSLIARGIHPDMLVLTSSSATSPNGRLSLFTPLFTRFRFRHLHVRYVPQLQVTNSAHGQFLIGYSSDSSLIDGVGIGGTTGWSGGAGIVSMLQPNVAAPSWAPVDLELNWGDDQWYYCDPEGSNIGDTSDAEAVALRQVSQGLLCFIWADYLNNGSSTILGNYYIDYVVEFTDPCIITPDNSVAINLGRNDRAALAGLIRAGWRPSDEFPQTTTPTTRPPPSSKSRF